MGIFKIERVQEVKESTAPVEQAKVENESTESNSRTEGEVFGLEEKKTEQVVLKVDGALGQVFTNALNKMMAVESMVMIPMSEDQIEEGGDTSKIVVPTIIHAEILDPSLLQVRDIVSISDEAQGHQGEQYVVATEGTHLNRASGKLHLLNAHGNVDVRYTMSGAIDLVLAKCREALK